MIKRTYYLLAACLLAAIILFLLCFTTVMSISLVPDDDYMDETYRPQYHFTAEKNMINDPNGLVYYKGVWHLYHQYNIFDAIYWGHATSTDLIHWKPQQPALAPDSIGNIFSGSVVVDTNNTSGLQSGKEKVLVAVFTYAEHNGGGQSQGIAYSIDGGYTWTKYSGNPVIPNPGQSDFRDPKVFWHEPANRWIMVVVAGDHVEFWNSPNLKDWTKAADWGAAEAGCHGGHWETPDLFELPVDGSPNHKKWVLSVGVMGGAPNGGLGSAYFVGSFDGKQFTSDNGPSSCLWQNYGKDYYAGVTWNNVPASDGRRLMIGWADSWEYRFDLPTTPFNGQLSLIKVLKLKTFPEGVRLVKTPITEYQKLRGTVQSWSNEVVAPGTNLLSDAKGDKLEIIAEFDAASATATEFGIKVRKGVSDATVVGYDKSASEMFVDRTGSGMTPNPSGFNPNPYWAGKHMAPLSQVDGKITLHIFVDRSSVEVLGNEREWISDLILPDRSSLGLETYAVGGNVKLKSLKVYPMKRIWSDKSPFTSSSLSGWSKVKGEWADTIHGKEGSADGEGFILASQMGSDFIFSADITIKGANAGNPRTIKQEAAGGIVFRANKSVSEGYAAYVDANTDSLQLIKYNGKGSSTLLGSYSTAIYTNTAYNIMVVTKGSTIKVYLNDKLRIDRNDTAYSSGFAGFSVRDAVANYNHVIFKKGAYFTPIFEDWKALAERIRIALANRKFTAPHVVSGTWTDLWKGTKGMAAGDGFAMSDQQADNFSYEADVNISGSFGGKSAAALVFRANNTATQGYVANLDALHDCVTLFKFNGDGTSMVIKRFAYSIDSDRIYRLKAEAHDDQIKIYLDGRLVIDEVDPSFKRGLLGLNVWNSQSTFKNINLTLHAKGTG